MVRYRKGIIVLGVVLLCVLGVILVRERLMKSSPLEKLEKSVGYSEGMVHFTVPEEYDSSWYIQISGRLETEGGGMSVHYLDEESEAGSWEKGRLYSFLWRKEAGVSWFCMFLREKRRRLLICWNIFRRNRSIGVK